MVTFGHGTVFIYGTVTIKVASDLFKNEWLKELYTLRGKRENTVGAIVSLCVQCLQNFMAKYLKF